MVLGTDSKVKTEEIWDSDTVYFVPNLDDPGRDEVYDFLDEASEKIKEYEEERDFRIGIPSRLQSLEEENQTFEEIYKNHIDSLESEARRFGSVAHGLGKGDNLGEYLVGILGGIGGAATGYHLAGEELGYIATALGTAGGVGLGIKLTQKVKGHFRSKSKEIRERISNLEKLKLDEDYEVITG